MMEVTLGLEVAILKCIIFTVNQDIRNKTLRDIRNMSKELCMQVVSKLMT